jgi:hypothetical protein
MGEPSKVISSIAGPGLPVVPNDETKIGIAPRLRKLRMLERRMGMNLCRKLGATILSTGSLAMCHFKWKLSDASCGVHDVLSNN